MKHPEDDMQMAVFRWASYYPQLDTMFHPPNGGRRNKREAGRLKRLGVKPGVPDIVLPVAMHGHHALFIELKAGKNTLTEKQKAFVRGLEAGGNRVAICRSSDEARVEISKYMDIEV